MATLPKEQRVLPFIHPDDMPDRYAIPGHGTCMEPLIADGAVIAFDKTKQPRRGDIVSIIFTPAAARRRGIPGMIKLFVSALNASIIEVEQVNPPRVHRIPTTDVLAIHGSIGIAESSDGRFAQVRLPKQEA